MIVPRSLLGEIGITTGAKLDLRVEDGKLIATPMRSPLREGWSLDAAELGPGTEEEAEWRRFGNQGDAELEW